MFWAAHHSNKMIANNLWMDLKMTIPSSCFFNVGVRRCFDYG